MGLSEYYTGVIYGFRIEKESAEKATGAYQYKGEWDGRKGEYIGKCFETYISLLRNPYTLTKKYFNPEKNDAYDDYNDGKKIEELDELVEMSASGDDYSREPINETEAYLSFHKIKVSGWYDNIIDPNQMIEKQKFVQAGLVEKTKQWAESKGLKLINKEPHWFILRHTSYY